MVGAVRAKVRGASTKKVPRQEMNQIAYQALGSSRFWNNQLGSIQTVLS